MFKHEQTVPKEDLNGISTITTNIIYGPYRVIPICVLLIIFDNLAKFYLLTYYYIAKFDSSITVSSNVFFFLIFNST